MATGQRNTYGRRRRFKGRTGLPNGQPRSSMATAKLPGRANHSCKPSVGFTKHPVYETGQPSPDILKLRTKYVKPLPPNTLRVGGEARPIGGWS
jgi:hypothetical protein